jgi:Protein of unknown function
MIDPFDIGLAALLGGGAGALASRGDSFYHDALRPLAPDLRDGSTGRTELARYGWGVSHRFIAWFALPFSLLSGAVVSCLIFLPADVIGLRFKSRTAAVLVTAVLGAILFTLIQLAHSALGGMRIDVVQATRVLVRPVLWLYPLVPIVAALKLPNPRSGALYTGAVEAAVAGTLALLGASGAVAPASAVSGLLSIFALHMTVWNDSDKAARVVATVTTEDGHIRRSMALLVLIGAAVALLAHGERLAGEPMAAMLVGDGKTFDAAAVALITATAFFPLVVMSSSAADSYSTQGTPDSIPAVGYILPGAGPAAVGGAAVMAIEILSLRRSVALLLRRPSISRLAGAVRESLGDVMLTALLFGGFWMAAVLGGGIGVAAVGAAWYLNEHSGAPVTRFAVAPSAALIVGLAANLWLVIK